MNNKQNIQAILERHPDGLTIKELGLEASLTRQTIYTILAEFRGAKLIRERWVGQAKLIFWIGGGE